MDIFALSKDIAPLGLFIICEAIWCIANCVSVKVTFRKKKSYEIWQTIGAIFVYLGGFLLIAASTLPA